MTEDQIKMLLHEARTFREQVPDELDKRLIAATTNMTSAIDAYVIGCGGRIDSTSESQAVSRARIMLEFWYAAADLVKMREEMKDVYDSMKAQRQ